MSETNEKQYSDLDDAGLLLRLPCCIGSTMWTMKFGNVEKFTVTGFSTGKTIGDDGNGTGKIRLHCMNDQDFTVFSESEIGAVCFFTEEEAEHALNRETKLMQACRQMSEPDSEMLDKANQILNEYNKLTELLEEFFIQSEKEKN